MQINIKKKLFSKENFIDNIIYYISPVFMFPIFSIKLKSISIMYLFVILLAYSIINKNKIVINKETLRQVFFLSVIYYITIFSSVFSENYNVAFKTLEHSLIILLFPLFLCFSNIRFNKNNIKKLLSVYVFSCGAYSILIVFLFIFSKTFTDFDVGNLPKLVNKIPYIGTHYIRLSYQLGLGLILLTFLKINKVLKFLLSVVFLMSLILLMSKGVLISLFFIFVLILLKGKSKVHHKILVFLTVSSVITLSIIFIKPLNTKFLRLYKLAGSNPTLRYQSSTLVRSGIYMCSYDIIMKNKFFGVGVGDIRDELNDCYKEKFNLPSMLNLKTHNQYVYYLLTTGVVGFIIIISFFIHLLVVSLKNRMYLCFLLFSYMCFVTEDLLLVNVGLFSFILINCVLYIYSRKING